MTAWMSFARPGAAWVAVRIVTGLVPSEVLHWRLIEPGVETSKRVCCGQEVPPDADAACRMSATTVPRSYAPVHDAVICKRKRQATATDIVLRNGRRRFALIWFSPRYAQLRRQCASETPRS